MIKILILHRRATTVLEYAVLITVIAVGLTATFSYFKRSIQHRFKRNADVFSDRQYAPGETIIIGQ